MSIVNLLPQEYIERRSRRRANIFCLVLFAVVMAGVLGAALVSENSIRNTVQVRDQVAQKYQEATKLIAQMQQLEAKRSRMINKAENTASLLERIPRSYLLAMVTNALPEQASLSQMTLNRKKIISSGSKGKGPETVLGFTITGLAATDIDVARLIANLARDPITTNVDLVFSQEKDVDVERFDRKFTVRNFKIDVGLDVDADVIEVLQAEAEVPAMQTLARIEEGVQ